MEKRYMMVRYYASGRKRIIKINMTRDDVMSLWNDPERSFKTCVKPKGIARTAKMGPWFDGYVEQADHTFCPNK
jgi:hypothetical protein